MKIKNKKLVKKYIDDYKIIPFTEKYAKPLFHLSYISILIYGIYLFISLITQQSPNYNNATLFMIFAVFTTIIMAADIETNTFSSFAYLAAFLAFPIPIIHCIIIPILKFESDTNHQKTYTIDLVDPKVDTEALITLISISHILLLLLSCLAIYKIEKKRAYQRLKDIKKHLSTKNPKPITIQS